MSDGIIPAQSYPGYYPQDPVPSDIHQDENRGCQCIGFAVALIIIAVVLQLPGILGGNIIYAGGPFSILMIWGLLFAPLIIVGLVFRWYERHRHSVDLVDDEI